MIRLSIVIVNYNVTFFLEQCLHSIKKAVKNITHEIYVVDNNSVDGSCQMVKEKFPDVKLIENKNNLGFSKANNQAIRIAKGEYILLLNPDTVVQEDTFSKCIVFMDNHKDAGSLGVKMIDGKGRFLPESKRALPTPAVAFFKIFGISSLFPKSKIFNRYHLGYLDKEKIHEVEILPGAYMFIRKEALDKIGLLDEDFFMYGEDVDLSYRFLKAGYKNYYFPETTIIHYKGESTKKGSINYVIVFYKAMIIFVEKHFTKRNAKMFSLIINFAIYFRSFLSIIKRFISSILLPSLDFLSIYIAYTVFYPMWENVRFSSHNVYPDDLLHMAILMYSICWIIAVFLSGGYDKPVKISNVFRGIVLGTIVILVIYALVPENFRFSRALILLGSLWAFCLLTINRIFFHFFKISNFQLAIHTRKKIVIVGNLEEANRVFSIIKETGINHELIGFVNPIEQINSNLFIGNLNQLSEIVKIYKIDEVIFCSKELTTQDIISNMLQLSTINVDFKIAPPESLSVIGSNSINTSGDLYAITFNSILRPLNKRNKRIFDICTSFIFILFSPLFMFGIKNKKQFFKNCLSVLMGFKTWVGYNLTVSNVKLLPNLKKSILYPSDIINNQDISIEMIEKLNIMYAKDYKLINDFSILFKSIYLIGRKAL